MAVQTFRRFNESEEFRTDDLDVLIDTTDAMKDKDNVRVDKEGGVTTVNVFTDGKMEQYDSCRVYYVLWDNFDPNFFVGDVDIPDMAKVRMGKFTALKMGKDYLHQYIVLLGEMKDRLNLDPPYYVAVWYRKGDTQDTMPAFMPSVNIKNL